MKNSHKIGLLCCALTPTAFADEPASNPASDVINIIVPPIESIPPEQLVRKEEEFKWGDVTEPTPQTTRWNNAFSLKVKTGMVSHNHTQTLVFTEGVPKNEKQIEAKATSPYVGTGLSWSTGALSLSINGQRTDRRNIGGFEEGSTLLGSRYRDSIFWREDYDISASWRFELTTNHSLSLFGGYKLSKTHYDTKKSTSKPTVPTTVPTEVKIPTGTTIPSGTVTGVTITPTPTGTTTTPTTVTTPLPVTIPSVSVSVPISPKGIDVDLQKVSFDSKGPFIGLGYAWRISELSDTRIGLTVAYGKLKGASNQTDILATEPNKPDVQNYISEGTQGLRYGLYLTGPIYRSKWGELNYTLGVDAYNYTIKQYRPEKLSTTSGKLIPRADYTDKESVLSVGGSIGYTFDL